MGGRLAGNGPLGGRPKPRPTKQDDVMRDFERMGKQIREQSKKKHDLPQPLPSTPQPPLARTPVAEMSAAEAVLGERTEKRPPGTPAAPDAATRSPLQRFQLPIPHRDAQEQIKRETEERASHIKFMEQNKERREAHAFRDRGIAAARAEIERRKAERAERRRLMEERRTDLEVKKALETVERQYQEQKQGLFGMTKKGLGIQGTKGAPAYWTEEYARNHPLHRKNAPILGAAQDFASAPLEISKQGFIAGAEVLGKGIEAAQETPLGEFALGPPGSTQASEMDMLEQSLLHSGVPQGMFLGSLGATGSWLVRKLAKGKKLAELMETTRISKTVEMAARATETHGIQALGKEKLEAKFWDVDDVVKFTGESKDEILRKTRMGEIVSIPKVKKNANLETIERALAGSDFKYDPKTFLVKRTRENLAALRKFEAEKLHGVDIATFSDLQRAHLPDEIKKLPLPQQAKWYKEEMIKTSDAIERIARSMQIGKSSAIKSMPAEWNIVARKTYSGESGKVLQVQEQMRRTYSTWERPYNKLADRLESVTLKAHLDRGLKRKEAEQAAKDDLELLYVYIEGTGDSTRELTAAQVKSYIEGRPELVELANETKGLVHKMRVDANSIADEEFLRNFNPEGDGFYLPIRQKKGVTIQKTDEDIFKVIEEGEKKAMRTGGGGGKQVTTTRASSQIKRRYQNTEELIEAFRERGIVPEVVNRNLPEVLRQYGNNTGRAVVGRRVVKELVEARSADGLPFIIANRGLPEGALRSDFTAVRNKAFDDFFPGREVLVHNSVYKEVSNILKFKNDPNKALNAMFKTAQVIKGAELFGSFFHGWAELENAFASLTRFKQPLGSIAVGKKRANRILEAMGAEGVSRPLTPAALGRKIEEDAPAMVHHLVNHGLVVDMSKASQDQSYNVYSKIFGFVESKTKDIPVLGKLVKGTKNVALAPQRIIFERMIPGNKIATATILHDELLGGVKNVLPDGTIQFVKDSYKGQSAAEVSEKINNFVNYAYGGQPWILFPDAKVFGKNVRDIAMHPSKWGFQNVKRAVTDSMRPVGPTGELLIRTAVRAIDWKQSGMGVLFKAIADMNDPIERQLYGTYWRNMIMLFPPKIARKGVQVGGKVVKYGGAAAVGQYAVNKLFNEENKPFGNVFTEMTDALGITGEGVTHVASLTGRVNITPLVKWKQKKINSAAQSAGLPVHKWGWDKPIEHEYYLNPGKQPNEEYAILGGVFGLGQAASNAILGTKYNYGENLGEAANWALSSLSTLPRALAEAMTGHTMRFGDNRPIPELQGEMTDNEKALGILKHLAKTMIPFSARSENIGISILGQNVSRGLTFGKSKDFFKDVMNAYAVNGDPELRNTEALTAVYYANREKMGNAQKSWKSAKLDLLKDRRTKFFNALKDGNDDLAFLYAEHLKRLGETREGIISSARAKEINDQIILSIASGVFEDEKDRDLTLDFTTLIEVGNKNLDHIKDAYNKKVKDRPDLKIETNDELFKAIDELLEETHDLLEERAREKMMEERREKPLTQEETGYDLLREDREMENMSDEELKKIASLGQ